MTRSTSPRRRTRTARFAALLALVAATAVGLGAAPAAAVEVRPSSSSDPAPASLSGRITGPDGSAADGFWVSIERWDGDSFTFWGSTYARGGAYTFDAVPPGEYSLEFRCSTVCAASYLPEWWNDRPDEASADRFTLAEGEIRQGMDISVSTGSSLGGTVTGFGDVSLDGVGVDLHQLTPTGYRLAKRATTDSMGSFAFTGLWQGKYSMQFRPIDASRHLAQWWGGSPASSNALPFDLPKDQVVDVMDMRLTAAATVSGIVHDADGTPAGSWATLRRHGPSWEWMGSKSIDAAGRYTFTGVPPGSYTIEFGGDSSTGHLGEWWDDRPASVLSDAFSIGEGEVRSDFDTELSTQRVQLAGPVISNVTVGSTTTAGTSSTTPGARLEHHWYVDSREIVGVTGDTITLGADALGKTISVRVVASAPGFTPVMADASPRVVGPQPPPPAPWGDVSRISGPDRYATSVAISRGQFAPGVENVFIANGANFPDALAGAPMAALRNGPLLLTPANELPDSVIAEIKRLNPTYAVILGGTGAVSAKVEEQLWELTDYFVPPRFAGTDRYATSVSISKAEFPTSASQAVYIANGADFPDALAGAPAAARDRAPLLLSSTFELPAVVAGELERLEPTRIVILGGHGSISADVARRLEEYTTGSVTRLSGDDRYSTAVAISQEKYDPDVPVAYIANGADFPDALSGAPVAALQDGPILLTPTNALPTAVIEELERLRPGRIVILGGTGAVSSMVQAHLESLG